jgi:hypothetical protein
VKCEHDLLSERDSHQSVDANLWTTTLGRLPPFREILFRISPQVRNRPKQSFPRFRWTSELQQNRAFTHYLRTVLTDQARVRWHSAPPSTLACLRQVYRVTSEMPVSSASRGIGILCGGIIFWITDSLRSAE